MSPNRVLSTFDAEDWSCSFTHIFIFVSSSIFDLLFNVITSFCLLPSSHSLYCFSAFLTIPPTEILNCHSYPQTHQLCFQSLKLDRTPCGTVSQMTKAVWQLLFLSHEMNSWNLPLPYLGKELALLNVSHTPVHSGKLPLRREWPTLNRRTAHPAVLLLWLHFVLV